MAGVFEPVAPLPGPVPVRHMLGCGGGSGCRSARRASGAAPAALNDRAQLVSARVG